MSPALRNSFFVLAGALAGFLSGLFQPLAFGGRGAILGALLSGGAVFLRPVRTAAGEQAPKPERALLLALVVAALATGLMYVWHLFLPDEGRNLDFRMDPLASPARFAACLALAWPLFRFYRARLAGGRGTWAWFAAAPLSSSLIRAIGYRQIGTAPFILLMGALPFVLLWLLAALLADPAWTKRRRDNLAAGMERP